MKFKSICPLPPAPPPPSPTANLPRRALQGGVEVPDPVVRFLAVLEDGRLVQLVSEGEGYRKFTVHSNIQLWDGGTGAQISPEHTS